VGLPPTVVGLLPLPSSPHRGIIPPIHIPPGHQRVRSRQLDVKVLAIGARHLAVELVDLARLADVEARAGAATVSPVAAVTGVSGVRAAPFLLLDLARVRVEVVEVAEESRESWDWWCRGRWGEQGPFLVAGWDGGTKKGNSVSPDLSYTTASVILAIRPIPRSHNPSLVPTTVLVGLICLLPQLSRSSRSPGGTVA
jgi:hypothetical protein